MDVRTSSGTACKASAGSVEPDPHMQQRPETGEGVELKPGVVVLWSTESRGLSWLCSPAEETDGEC